MPSEGSVCARCAEVNGSVCCELPPGSEERLATLTFADMARIREATGMPEHRFVEREDLSAGDVAAFEEARPLYRGMFVGGVRHGLKAKDGKCVFLERGRGCVLDGAAKPLACRLYPFDLAAEGQLTAVDAPHCLALSEAADPEALLALFGLTEAGAERLLRQARGEAREHAERLSITRR